MGNLEERRSELFEIRSEMEVIKKSLENAIRDKQSLKQDLERQTNLNEQLSLEVELLREDVLKAKETSRTQNEDSNRADQELIKAKAQHNEELRAIKTTHENKMIVLKTQFEQEIQQLKSDSQKLTQNNLDLRIEADKLRLEKSASENELLTFKKKLSDATQKLSEDRTEMLNEQLQQSQVRIAALESSQTSESDKQSLLMLTGRCESLEAELASYKKQQNDFKRVKMDLEKAYLDNASLKDRANRLENTQSEIAELKSSVVKLNIDLLDWSRAFPNQTPIQVSTHLRQIESNNKNNSKLTDTIREELYNANNDIQRIQQTANQHENTISKLREELEEAFTKSNTLENEVTLLKKELERKNSQLESFKLESQMTQEQRMTENENTISRLQSELKDSETTMIENQKRINLLEQQIAHHDHRLGRGDVNKENFKVLHMSINPELKAMSEKEDLSGLKAKNKLLSTLVEDLKKKCQDQGSVSSSEMNKKIEDYELSIKRLKEVFKKRIDDFRRVIYLLFGFRIDVERETLFKLSSMYAEAEDDFVVFSRKDEKTLNLLESDFANSLEPRVMDQLTRLKSIPAFLSTITLDLMSKQTVFLS
ncbi:mitotic spindle assembly checkpoint protein MAD1 [Acrasis kona]|uniref:Mitotic spindle assembly checkpoint protein MAD1 n=1 Tax=Acrasis kona TaxID=1008807 RepID=A0AAW2ZK71_9EUKA